MSEQLLTKDRSTQAALLALLDTIISDPWEFAPLAIASAAEQARNMIVALDSSLTARDIEIERLKKFEPVCKCDPAGWNLSPIPPPCNHFEWDGGNDKVKVCVRCEHDETCHGARS